MANGKTIKKVAGWGGLGLILATTIVMSLGKDIAAWPSTTTKSILANKERLTSVEKEVTHQKETTERIEVDLKEDIAGIKKEMGRQEIRQETRHNELKDLIREGR